jgi:hypothetical protein
MSSMFDLDRTFDVNRTSDVNRMFDIYTLQSDGTLLLVESVSSQSLAQETAYQLSVLFPDESFIYCHRSDECADLSQLMPRPVYSAASSAFLS